MSRDNGQGIFTMEVITKISKMKSLAEAKSFAQEVVNNSTANDENKRKATVLIVKASSINSLAISMSNFSLSHQGLKTI